MKRSTNGKNRVVAAMATWEFGTLAVEECVSLLQQEGRSYTSYHDHKFYHQINKNGCQRTDKTRPSITNQIYQH